MSDLYDLDAERFLWVSRGIGREETRYYLQGVHIEPRDEGGAWLVATDGRLMLVAEDPSARAPKVGTFRVRFVPPDPVYAGDDDSDDDFRPRPGRLYSRARLRWIAGASESLCRVGANGGTILSGVAERIDGKFPDWRKALDIKLLLASRPAPAIPALNVDFLRRAAGELGLIAGQRIGEASAATILLPDNMPWGFGVVMHTAIYSAGIPEDAAVRHFFGPEHLPSREGGAR